MKIYFLKHQNKMDIVLQVHDRSICDFCHHMDCNDQNYTKIIHVDGDHCLFEISKKIRDDDGQEYQHITSISRISCPLSCHLFGNSTQDSCKIETLEFNCPPFLPPLLPPFRPSPSPPPIKSPSFPKPSIISDEPMLPPDMEAFPPSQAPSSQSPPSQSPPSQSPPSQTPPSQAPPSQAPPSQAPAPNSPFQPTSPQINPVYSRECDSRFKRTKCRSSQLVVATHTTSLHNQYLMYIIVALTVFLIFLMIVFTFVILKWNLDKKMKEEITAAEIEMISV